jgi:hypothetical protein
MSITYYDFTPVPTANYTFQPTLDGQVYNATVTFNMAAQRYYLAIAGLDGTLIVNKAMVGSPNGANLAELSWANGFVTGTLANPIPYRIGSTVALTITGSTPDAYNGQVLAYVTGRYTFTYPLMADPGAATRLGVASENISLTAGYFNSTLVYRIANNQIEVSP